MYLVAKGDGSGGQARPGQLKKLQFVWGSHKRNLCCRMWAPWSQNSGATLCFPPCPTTPTPLSFLRTPSYGHESWNPQDGKCTSLYFRTKLHLHMGNEEVRRLIIGCCINQSRQRIHHLRHHCQEPGGSKTKNRYQKFNWNTSLNASPQSVHGVSLSWCLPASVPQLSQILFESLKTVAAQYVILP